ncbi:YnfA family protein [Flavobacterium adhaerens]|uniref:YnfA family protein n=1 Tax=Flavobacterium adhaerens TaxID=3149043 RepID=UPI0032B3428B
MISIIKITVYFILAGLCEIGGGYLVWLWLKEEKSVWYGVTGAIILALYGYVMTLQTSSFGKSYVVYGGIFIVMALLWAWKIDNFKPDKYDWIGTAIILIGIAVILFMPRK